LYNQPTEIPNTITHLTLGECYDQPTKIPNTVTHLKFGRKYNQPTEIPNTVIMLIHNNNEIKIGTNTDLFKFKN
jgi:FNIP Repeat